MLRMLCSKSRVLLIAALLLVGVVDAQAQAVRMRLVEEHTGSAVYEMTAAWPNSLKAVLDSVNAVTLDGPAALAVSGGVFSQSATVHLPSLAQPQVRVLAADFDEVRLDAAEGTDDLVGELNQASADVVGLGVERKKPAATVRARLLTYDPETRTLRRYRRLLIGVDYGSSQAAKRLNTMAVQGVADNPHLSVDRSVLADGVVFKIAIKEEGIYRIDRAFLTSLPGFDLAPGSIDPNDVKVYGNGGAPLPALNSDDRIPDLAENQVFVQGGGDGSFDSGDAVLFYATGPTGWRSVVQRDQFGDPLLDGDGNVIRQWEHYVNPFSNDNYYFIKISDGENDRFTQASYPNLSGATPVSKIVGRYFVDMDDFLWAREKGGTGHTWVSNLIALGGGTLPILENVSLPGLASGTVTYRARPAIQSNPVASVFFKSNGTLLNTSSFGGVTNNPDATVARSGIVDFEQTVNAGQALNLIMELENAPSSPKAALDWLRVFYPKNLTAVNGLVRLHTPIGQTGVFEMALTGFNQEPQVWDVTTQGAFRRLGVQASGGTYRIQVEVVDPDQPHELVAFTNDAVRTLNADEVCLEEGGCRIDAQNLHGIAGYPAFVIVAPAIFRPYADELAEKRRQEGLSVEVVDVQDIYNEFAGGLPDMRALRDYFRFLYDRAPTEAQTLRYVLLFGDGHYNYRNLDEAPPFKNWIPPFETEESWAPEVSYTSDDYFGLLDDNEGLWPYTRTTFPNDSLNERVDIGIGRFTVQTEADARAVVDKIKHYESPETYGPWRERYLFFADDGPTGLAGVQNDKDLHTQNTDVVATLVEADAPEINQKKVYAISYQRVFRNVWRIPDARQDILAAIREGVLVVNYSGHGGEDALAQEDLFNREDARSLDNFDTLPIFITATCSFGRWDLANEQSGAEELLLNPNGGAVAMLTTVRTVYTTGVSTTSLNVGLNIALNRELFKKDEDGLPRRLGDVLRDTKNTQVGYEGNNRKFNLLGDPTMRIGMPSNKAVITHVNDAEVTSGAALPLRALERVTVEGEIQTPDGVLATDFNGNANVTVFDAQRQIGIPDDKYQYMPQRYYNIREDLIWRGKVNVSSGVFSATFVVPKDISYSNRPGRISIYAASGQSQAQGFTEDVTVGGTTANPPDDAKGPEIELYLNDETFVDGGLTTEQPELIVKLFDDSGINTVGAGVGHEMLLVVDGDEQNAVNIGDLYESEEDSYQRGRVVFPFEDELSPGQHALEVRAWDVLNNSGAATLDFTVTESQDLELRNVFNYPNPTTGPTRFVFEHNQPVGTPVHVQVRIYTLSGRPLRTLEVDDVLPGGPMQIPWDGRDDALDRPGPGVYLYKVRVEVEGAEGEHQVSEVIEKLALVR